MSSHRDNLDQHGEEQNPQQRNTGVMVVGMDMKAKNIQKDAGQEDLAMAAGQPRMLTCVVCKGTKKRGLKQKKCKTCKGTGMLSVDKFQGLLELVRGEIAVCMERSMRDVMLQFAG